MSTPTTTAPVPSPSDNILEATLRPRILAEYAGQTTIKAGIRILIQAAQHRNEPLDHILLYGGAGLGKTTLAHVVAHEMQGSLKVTSGPAIEKVGDLAALLTNLQEGDIFFIDEAHRLQRAVEEVLYPAMEDFAIDIVIGKGPSARTLQLSIPRFTLIAATTRIGMLSNPLRSRFGVTYQLAPYNEEELLTILCRSARLLNVNADKSALSLIAQRSRQTPRVANRLLKRIRDFAQVERDGVITSETALAAFALLNIDALGLEPADRRLLQTLITTFNGGPAGIQTLAAALGEEEDTITDLYEPFLLQIGFLARTPKGRVATERAHAHLGLPFPGPQAPLL